LKRERRKQHEIKGETNIGKTKNKNVHFYERNGNEFCACASKEVFFRWKTNVPLEKYNLVALAAPLLLELKIVHCPATFGLRQIIEELIIVARRRVFNRDDLRLLVVDLEDDVLGLLLKFQLLKHIQTFWVYGYAGRLVYKSNFIGIYWDGRTEMFSYHLCSMCVGSGGVKGVRGGDEGVNCVEYRDGSVLGNHHN
jgi:hypothetical protein